MWLAVRRQCVRSFMREDSICTRATFLKLGKAFPWQCPKGGTGQKRGVPEEGAMLQDSWASVSALAGSREEVMWRPPSRPTGTDEFSVLRPRWETWTRARVCLHAKGDLCRREFHPNALFLRLRLRLPHSNHTIPRLSNRYPSPLPSHTLLHLPKNQNPLPRSNSRQALSPHHC